MNNRELLWQLFVQSGDPDAYIQYKRQEAKKRLSAVKKTHSDFIPDILA